MLNTAGQKDFDSEIQLIVECSRTAINSGRFEHIKHILAQPLNWIYVIESGSRNCVLPLLSWNLILRFNDFLSQEIKNSLNENLQKQTRFNMFLTGKLIEIIRLFEAHDVPVLPFKGPLLATQFYGNLSLRSFGDLDILVQKKHLETAVRLLIENGFEPVSKINWLSKNNLDLITKDVQFIHKENKIVIELHWKLGFDFAASFSEINRLWENAELANLAGSKVKSLSFNDLLIYLCYHGGKHGWYRLSWICDINELIARKGDDIQWEQINKEAIRLGCEKALGLGMYLIREFFGRETPVLQWQKRKNLEIYKELTEQIRSVIFTDDPALFEIKDRKWFLEQHLFHSKIREKFWDKAKLHLYYNHYHLKKIFSPNKTDETLLKLPSWMKPLYYITRPTRLFYTYFLKFKKSKYSRN